jgi:hypothetical protein
VLGHAAAKIVGVTGHRRMLSGFPHHGQLGAIIARTT